MADISIQVTTTQLYSRNALGYIWGIRDTLDPGQIPILDALYKNRNKTTTTECSQTVTYNLSHKNYNKDTTMTSCRSASSNGWGRLYGSKGSFETLERKIRGTLCKDFYVDIDIKNCHPVILSQLIKTKFNKDMPELDTYIQNREYYLTQTTKEDVIRVLYGGKNENEFLKPFAKEIRDITKFISNQPEYIELFSIVKKANPNNIYGTFLSYILQTEERKAMLEMKRFLEEKGFSVDVLCYDGVMVRKDVPLTDVILRELEQSILTKIGYEFTIVIKPFDEYYEFVAEGEYIPKVKKTDYLNKKAEFEQHHFYHIPTNSIGRCIGGKLSFYNIEHAKNAFSNWDFVFTNVEDRKSWITLWMKDSTKKCAESISNKISNDPLIFYNPFVFESASIKYDEAKVDKVVIMWNTFMDIISGGNLEKKSYLQNYLAHILLKPTELPGVALLVTGGKGCGKDTVFDFFMQYVIGDCYSQNYSCNEQFWEKHNTGRMGKLFIKLEEAQGFINKKNDASFKSRITAYNQTFNPKGLAEVTVDNNCRYILTTNEGGAVFMDSDDRRWVVMAASPMYMKNIEFWESARELMFNKEAGAIIYKYLTENPEPFNVLKLPYDEMKEAIGDSLKSAEERFIKNWDGEECSMNELYDKYRNYCLENSINYCNNSIGFGKKLLVPIRDGLIIKKRSMDGTYYSKKK